MKQFPHRIKKGSKAPRKPPPDDHGTPGAAGAKGQGAQPRPQPTPSSPWRWPTLVLCLVLTAGATWAVVEFVGWSRIPHALAGKWVVQGGEQDGATFDFHRNGTMIGRINVRGKEAIIDARVRVEGDSLLITTRNPTTQRDEVRSLKIEKLTPTQLILEDPRGVVMRMEKAQ